MTVALPSPIPTSSQWQLQGWRWVTQRSSAAAAGAAAATLPQLDTDVLWLIDRAVVTCSSTSTTSLRLYDSLADPVRLLSGTDRGNYDEAEYPSGLLLESGSQLVAVWTGASTAAVGTIRLQVRELRRA